MSHDHNGRVGGPRCEECNAPLGADDGPYLCQECQIVEAAESFLQGTQEDDDAGLSADRMFLRDA